MGPGENFLQYTTGGIFLDMVAQFKNEKVYFSFRHWGIWTQWQMDTWEYERRGKWGNKWVDTG